MKRLRVFSSMGGSPSRTTSLLPVPAAPFAAAPAAAPRAMLCGLLALLCTESTCLQTAYQAACCQYDPTVQQHAHSSTNHQAQGSAKGWMNQTVEDVNLSSPARLLWETQSNSISLLLCDILVPLLIWHVAHNEDEVKARQDGCLQVDVVTG
jgi:hypothetical protein